MSAGNKDNYQDGLTLTALTLMRAGQGVHLPIVDKLLPTGARRQSGRCGQE